MGHNFSHLSRSDRITIEAMLKAGSKKRDIAAKIGVHEATIYREIKRGEYVHRNSDWTEETRYSPDIAEDRYQENLRAKGPGLKIGNDIELARYIEARICDDGLSPEAVLGEIRQKNLPFKTQITKTTLYSYIDKGIFERLTNKALPVKGRRKKKYKKVRKQARKQPGDNIEKRPKEIEDREEFGHWEMDTVIGKRGASKHSLLVLTERKTREEIIRILPEHTADRVVQALDRIEADWGDSFSRIFKTITVDNGSEFMDCCRLERSAAGPGSRTKVYYCHPYSSFERGSNENQNRLIRRWVPKGTNFDDRTPAEIQAVEDWVNDYPRRIFGFRTAADLFEEELAKLA